MPDTILQLCKEIVDTHNDEAVKMVQQEILESLFEIATHDATNSNPDRGKTFLGINACINKLLKKKAPEQ